MVERREPFLAWPGAAFRETLPLCLMFAALFVVCYGSASWLAGRHESLPAWNLAFESRIPFVPSLALIYLTITPVLMLAPFVFRTRSQLAPLAAALSIETLVASVLFVLVPQKTAWIRPPVAGWIRIPFEIADTLNLQYNEFPSLHVAFAFSAAWAYAIRSRGVGRLGWTIWSFAVAISTWLLWEHHLVDIVGGVALAIVVMGLVYPWLQKAETKQIIWVELCCLLQCVRFSLRHIRYFVIFLAIYLPSLFHWRKYRPVRVAFCVAQWIDDLLDGDRASAREPLDVVDELLDEMSRGTFSAEPLSRLTGALFEELEALRTGADDPKGDFVALVREMRRDRERVLGRELWSEQELDEHHRSTFRLSVNLMLITAGCGARAFQVPALIEALAWCSTFRDLEDDLSRNLINVPRGVVERLTDHALPLTTKRLMSSVEYRDWVHESHGRARAALQESAIEIARLDDARGRPILEIFQNSVVKFARKFSARMVEQPARPHVSSRPV